MIIGIISAMQIELKLLIEEFDHVVSEKVGSIDFFRGTLKDNTIVASISGIGKVNAKNHMSSIFENVPN